MIRLHERFTKKISPDPNSGCWLWTGARRNGRNRPQEEGYGLAMINGKTRSVHRVIYEIFNGAIPDGLVIDHICRVRSCVNPDHMELVTNRENIIRGNGPIVLADRNRKKTHCPKGHPYSGNNLYVTRNGWRQCKTCRGWGA